MGVSQSVMDSVYERRLDIEKSQKDNDLWKASILGNGKRMGK